MFTAVDEALMTHALQLAQRGLYTTDPNPRVGCIIAHGGNVLGEGWHRKAGEPHAEVHALAQAGAYARGATAYVTLEPCSHHGRTPPCAEALIAAGLKRVVVAMTDPNPLVHGQGLARLRAAGIEVRSGLLQAQAEALNAGFIKRMRTGMPLVRVKLAASLDGRTALANGVSRWISSEASRADVQRWRARSSAILTGVGTVLADDPQLNVRAGDIDMLERVPLRVICDAQLQTPATARAVQAAGALIYTTVTPQARGQAEVMQIPADVEKGVELPTVLADLGRRGCNEVLVEAGARLSGRLFELRLVDELLLYVAPVLLGPEARVLLQLPLIDDMKQRIELTLLDTQSIGSDVRLHYRIQR
ncbi:MAG: bifunctional diaminohydroxyphosphoribosylaminopyrimidine deaminase/5-amino-6-(5-phosphoribosylamino)uracil reductase RibD [Steroidobacteraceae bacterium]